MTAGWAGAGEYRRISDMATLFRVFGNTFLYDPHACSCDYGCTVVDAYAYASPCPVGTGRREWMEVGGLTHGWCPTDEMKKRLCTPTGGVEMVVAVGAPSRADWQLRGVVLSLARFRSP